MIGYIIVSFIEYLLPPSHFTKHLVSYASFLNFVAKLFIYKTRLKIISTLWGCENLTA